MLSPTGRSARHGDAVLREVVGVADAGQHQDLRRPEDAGGEDDLLARADGAQLAVLVDDLYAGRAAVVDDHLGDVHLGLEAERRQGAAVDVAAGGAVAQAAGGVLLHHAGALLRLGVVVLEDLHAQRVRGRLHELERRLHRHRVAGDLDRAAGAAVGVLAVDPVLHPLVDGVDLVGGPAGVALGRPGVEVGPVAAHVDHAVDRARAADHLAARLRDLAVERVLLGRRVVAPVDLLLDLGDRVHRADHPGLLDEELLVALARLEQDHALPGLGQPGGQRAAGAAGPDDDVVGLVREPTLGTGLGHASPLARTRQGVAGPTPGDNCNAF